MVVSECEIENELLTFKRNGIEFVSMNSFVVFHWLMCFLFSSGLKYEPFNCYRCVVYFFFVLQTMRINGIHIYFFFVIWLVVSPLMLLMQT